jgi:hypothetical protein
MADGTAQDLVAVEKATLTPAQYGQLARETYGCRPPSEFFPQPSEKPLCPDLPQCRGRRPVRLLVPGQKAGVCDLNGLK